MLGYYSTVVAADRQGNELPAGALQEDVAGIAFEGDSWLAIMGPPGIPAEVAAKLNQEIAATLRQPETQERLAKIGLEVVASLQSELADVLKRDVPKWGKAVKDSGAVAD